MFTFLITLLRHDDLVHREDDGGERFDDLAEKSKAKFDGISQWSKEAWITFLSKGGSPKERFQCCLNPNSSEHFRTIQGHSGLLLNDFAEYAHDVHSMFQSGLIPAVISFKMLAMCVLGM